MSAFFITATGTDIGKTYVTAGLIAHARANGQSVSALKPVLSGFDETNPAPSDSGVLLTALGEPITPDALNRISPWRFTAPLSPDMAAAREGRSVPFAELVALSSNAAHTHQGTIFIEGVGGIMVPLDERHTVLDWMEALNLPLILVTGSYLGTISHTLTALDVVARKGLKVAALVVNQSPGDAPSAEIPLAETLATIARFTPAPTIALPRAGPATADFAPLWRLLTASDQQTACAPAGPGV